MYVRSKNPGLAGAPAYIEYAWNELTNHTNRHKSMHVKLKFSICVCNEIRINMYISVSIDGIAYAMYGVRCTPKRTNRNIIQFVSRRIYRWHTQTEHILICSWCIETNLFRWNIRAQDVYHHSLIDLLWKHARATMSHSTARKMLPETTVSRRDGREWENKERKKIHFISFTRVANVNVREKARTWFRTLIE